jgi:RNA polymerase sigma factor (sigma-70 family)
MELPDRELVSRVLKEGDEQAFRLLHGRHTPQLLRLARNLLAEGISDPEDLVQESWIRAAGKLDRFEWRSSLSTWLCGILINLVREAHRRRDRAWFVELSEDIEGAWPDPPDPTQRIELERAIAALAPGGRAVLVLHDVEGYTHQEIGELLGISPGTSKSQLCRARRAVKEFLTHQPKNVPYVRT